MSSWALFIVIMLLMVAFFTSYFLQEKKVTAIHETVISIFAGACGRNPVSDGGPSAGLANRWSL